jgi:multicomponent Na+:H+ antiporter subunit B
MNLAHLRMRDKIILRVVARAFIPFILLFGLYVQFHGDYGPGGGFQAGVIFAAGFMLYGIIFGLESLLRVMPWSVVERGLALGLLIYGCVGVENMLMQGYFLDYSMLDEADPKHGLHLGILIVELGVGLTVTMAMLAIFYSFSGRRRK